MGVYFLTGATGVVGSGVLSSLLAEPDHRIILLVRPNAKQTGAERVSALLEFLVKDKKEIKAGLSRISVFEGDAQDRRLGISEHNYNAIANQVTNIIHCAGNVKSNLPEDQAKSIAVGSVEAVLALAEKAANIGQLQKIDIVSTIGVAGRKSVGVREGRLETNREYHNSYELAKAEAEEVIWNAIDDGLPATIHRPSMVIGDSTNGKVLSFQVFYYICEFLSGVRTAGILPTLTDAKLDIIPVDYVSHAIHWSSEQTQTIGRALHLCSGPDQSISMSDLVHRIRREYLRNGIRVPLRKPLPKSVFRVMIPAIGAFLPESGRRRIKTLDFFLDYLEEPHEFYCEQTDSLLVSAEINKPASYEYLDRVLNYYLSHRKG